MEDSWQNLLVRFGPWFINEVGLDEYLLLVNWFKNLG